MTSDQWRMLAAYYRKVASLPFGEWPRGGCDRAKLIAEAEHCDKWADWHDKTASSVDNWSA